MVYGVPSLVMPWESRWNSRAGNNYARIPCKICGVTALTISPTELGLTIAP